MIRIILPANLLVPALNCPTVMRNEKKYRLYTKIPIYGGPVIELERGTLALVSESGINIIPEATMVAIEFANKEELMRELWVIFDDQAPRGIKV